MLVRDYRSDARIGIKALEIIDRENEWDDDSVRTALKQAYVGVEGETLKNHVNNDPLILVALVNYLQNLGLITLIKKRRGSYYTMESQILLSDESIVSGELRKRL